MKTSDDKIRIRLAGVNDCAAIVDTALAAYTMYIERMQAKPFPMLDDYAEHIRHKRVHVLENEHGVCGYVVLLTNDSDNILLDNIAVHPESQGAGYGRLLATFAEEWARTHGYSNICLYTNEVMTENLVWYQRLGYAITHRAVEKGYRRIYMAKAL